MLEMIVIAIAVLLALKFGFGKALGFILKYIFYPGLGAILGVFIGYCIVSNGAVILCAVIGAIVGLFFVFKGVGKDLR